MLNDTLVILIFPLTSLIKFIKFVLEGNILFLLWKKADCFSREVTVLSLMII